MVFGVFGWGLVLFDDIEALFLTYDVLDLFHGMSWANNKLFTIFVNFFVPGGSYFELVAAGAVGTFAVKCNFLCEVIVII